MPRHYDDLAEVRAAAELMLTGACADPAHAFRKPVLATIGPDGAPQARTVILREVDLGNRTLRLHTDARSSKIAEMEACPDVTLAFYDPNNEIQIQLRGQAAVHRDDAFADAAWEGAPPPSRRAYLAEAHPGTPSAHPLSGLPGDVEGIIPPLSRLAEGRGNFAAVRITYHRIEWLYLSKHGNRRARFGFESGGWSGTWLAP